MQASRTLSAFLIAAASCAGPSASPAAGPADQVPVAMASGPLQRCLGITPGGATMSPGAANAEACRQLPGADLYDQAGVRFQAGDLQGAARILLSAAEAGNPRAQLRLAMMYEQGQGVQRDKKTAVSWYTRAAAAGEPASQTELGGYYEEADGVPENCRQAVAWFRKAAAQGHARADYFARWLNDPTNNIGFRTDGEHDLVIAGKLRFALGAADPSGITFATSAQRVTWLRGLAASTNASEALTMWQIRKNEYDACQRNGGGSCVSPGPAPK